VSNLLAAVVQLTPVSDPREAVLQAARAGATLLVLPGRALDETSPGPPRRSGLPNLVPRQGYGHPGVDNESHP
jgi:hypothetical protein